MCLKLGKRHYFEDAAPPLLDHHHRHVAGFPLAMKRGKNLYGAGGGGGASTSSLKVPWCQVEGCQVSLVSAKEYHRRHKVCEMHSKASKVVVLGLEQRFCQQCSSLPSAAVKEKSTPKAPTARVVFSPELPPPAAIAGAARLKRKPSSRASILPNDSLPLELSKEKR
ncbi:hypothetical protein ACLB2K_013096 [Fragaria x ananassa]